MQHNQIKEPYSLSLEDAITMLSAAIKGLKVTNEVLVSIFNKEQQSYMTVSMEKAISIILGESGLTNIKMLYSIYGAQLFTIKNSINKRNEMIAHLSIMVGNLKQQIKEGNKIINFKAEEELFIAFMNVFHRKLFESPLFRKICNEIWRVTLTFKDNTIHKSQLLKEHLDLYTQGISEISIHKENYPLHKAVFDNDLPTIRRLCVGER